MEKEIIGYAICQIMGPIWAVGQSRAAILLEYERKCGPDREPVLEWHERHTDSSGRAVVICEATARLIEEVYCNGGDLRYDIDDFGTADLPDDDD